MLWPGKRFFSGRAGQKKKEKIKMMADMIKKYRDHLQLIFFLLISTMVPFLVIVIVSHFHTY